MDIEQKTIILGLASVIVGIAVLFNEEYRIYLVLFYLMFVIFFLFLSYFNKIDRNEEEIRRLKRNIDIHARLSRLEAKVLK